MRKGSAMAHFALYWVVVAVAVLYVVPQYSVMPGAQVKLPNTPAHAVGNPT